MTTHSNDDANESQRLMLQEAYLLRANTAADYLRTVLFALASAGAGFLATSSDAKQHMWTATAFGAAVALLVLSWLIQKDKSIKRFKTLRDEGLAAYREQEAKYEKRLQNSVLDYVAVGLIAAACFVEMIQRFA